MATKEELMAGGLPAALAKILGTDAVKTFSAAGTTQTGATLLTSSFANVTTVAVNSGVRMMSAGGQGLCVIVNNGANPLSVYPASGEKINGLAANTAIVVGIGKAVFMFGDNNQWGAVVGA